MPTISKSKMNAKAKKSSPAQVVAEPPAAGATLDILSDRLGPAGAAFTARTFRTAREADLVEAGTAIDSVHVIDDVPRFVGSALTIQAALSPAQKELVRFPQALLPLLVQEAVTLRDLKAKHEAQKTGDAAGKIERENKARQAMREGITERDTVRDSLRNALGDGRLDQLDAVTGTADTADNLAKGLEAIADFIDRVAKADPDDAAALEDYRAGPDRAESLRERAKAVRALGQATATSARRVTQRALDLQDGRVLLLIGKVLRAFRAARRADPTILVPELNRLARMFENRPKTRRNTTTTGQAAPAGAEPTAGQPA